MTEDQRDGNGSLAVIEYILACLLNNMPYLFYCHLLYMVKEIELAL